MSRFFLKKFNLWILRCALVNWPFGCKFLLNIDELKSIKLNALSINRNKIQENMTPPTVKIVYFNTWITKSYGFPCILMKNQSDPFLNINAHCSIHHFATFHNEDKSSSGHQVLRMIIISVPAFGYWRPLISMDFLEYRKGMGNLLPRDCPTLWIRDWGLGRQNFEFVKRLGKWKTKQLKGRVVKIRLKSNVNQSHYLDHFPISRGANGVSKECTCADNMKL
jgi:hypothetical protein